MYAIQRKDLKGNRIPILMEEGIEDYISVPFPVKAESVDTDEFYNTKLILDDGREVFAASIDLDFPEIVLGKEAEELAHKLVDNEFWKSDDAPKVSGMFEHKELQISETATIIMFDNKTNDCWMHELHYKREHESKAIVLALKWCMGEIQLDDIPTQYFTKII